MPVSIACFDDHPIFLNGLKGVFEEANGFVVVAVGSSAADIVDIGSRCDAQVLLVDLSMPGNVLEAIRTVTSLPLAPKIIAFTASASVDIAVRTLESGALGYVLKGSSADELFTAIKTVLAGETFVTPSFATKVIATLRQATMPCSSGRAVKFSTREDQIIRLLQRGWTNKEIALQLHISEKTVKHYMTLLMQKLNVRNRLEVIIAARNFADRPDPSQQFSRH